MKHNFTTGLLLIICTFLLVENVSSQIILHTVSDPQLSGARPSNIVSGPNGETLIMEDETIYTYTSGVTDVFECSSCFNIIDIAFVGDDMYIANESTGIVKRTGTETEVVTSLRALRLVADSLGNLYGVHFLEGLVFSDGSDWIQMTTTNSDIPTNTIYDLAIDQSGILWMATQIGLVSWDWITFTVISVPDDLSAAFFDIEIDSLDNKWVASAYGGVGKYDGIEWTTFPQDFSPLQAVENLATLNGNEIWTSDSGEGLYRYTGTSFEFIPYASLGESGWDINRVLFGDTQDRLWIYNDFTPLKYVTIGATGITDHGKASNALNIFPNPAFNECYIKTETGMEGDDFFVVVYSPEGRRVFSQQVIAAGGTLHLSFNNQPAGIYQVVVFENGSLEYTGRVCVQDSKL
jgi:hypothetical protein